MKKVLWLASLTIAAAGLSMASDTLVTSGNWYANSGPTNAGAYFWDHSSSDAPSAQCNVGFILLNGDSPLCSNSHTGDLTAVPGANIPFLAGATSGTPTAFAFTTTANTSHSSTFIASIAGNAGATRGEEFGWVSWDGSTLGSVLHPIFCVGNDTCPGPPPDTVSFTPDTEFVYYLKSAGNTYYTAGGTGGGNQFALFANGVSGSGSGTSLNTYWIGAEDTNISGGDKDYQDMVVKISMVPEPGFYGALALGLSGLSFAFRRRRAQ